MAEKINSGELIGDALTEVEMNKSERTDTKVKVVNESGLDIIKLKRMKCGRLRKTQN